MVITALLGTSFSFGQRAPRPRLAERLAIYYGYPSLVNGAQGDVEKAATVFAAYPVVVFGDGIEFPDRQAARHPAGDPAEHQKTIQIIEAVRRRSPGTHIYGYVPLGHTQSLKQEQIEERVRLWKQMGVAGIFLDEASYDFANVTRERQNMAVKYVHSLGLSVFMNGFFLDHLFSLEDKLPNENGSGKNPKRLAPLLDQRDMFLMESFQVSNGAYEEAAAWSARMKQALEYRRRYGTRIFAITTTTPQQPFDARKFNYAWWSAWVTDIDGFGWGEPNFSASDNKLNDHRCSVDNSAVAQQRISSNGADKNYVWRKTDKSLIIVDTAEHSVSRVELRSAEPVIAMGPLLHSSQGKSPLACGGI